MRDRARRGDSLTSAARLGCRTFRVAEVCFWIGFAAGVVAFVGALILLLQGETRAGVIGVVGAVGLTVGSLLLLRYLRFIKARAAAKPDQRP